VRERLGLGTPGESVIILPPNTRAAKEADKNLTSATTVKQAPISNFGQWMNFLFGRNSKSISG